MKILVLSDLHFEFDRDGGQAFCDQYRGFDDYDVAVIAGDLCDFKTLPRSLRLVGQTFKQVVYVIGNHECYGSSVEDTEDTVRLLCRKLGNVDYLACSDTVVDGQTFVGDTLWFPHDEYGAALEHTMTDFRLISDLSNDVDKLHAVAKEYFEEVMRSSDVLVTHHLPHSRSIHPKYAFSQLNRFFVGDIGGLIQQRQPKLAIHGHTHESCDYRIGKTRVVCNPRGYVGHELNPHFDPFFVSEV